MKSEKLMLLFQLTDSSFPTGGFVFSSGLESMAKHGFVKSIEDFKDFIKSYVFQIKHFDLQFIKKIFCHQHDPQYVCDIVCEYDCMLNMSSARKSSLTQGKNWLRTLTEMHPYGDTVRKLFEDSKWPAHVMLVQTCFLIKVLDACEEICHFYMYTQMRDLLSASVRLGLIGPVLAQKILSEALNPVGDSDAKDDEPYKSSYLLDIVAERHSRIYSKLFQN